MTRGGALLGTGAVVLSLAACGGGDEATPPATTTVRDTTTVTTTVTGTTTTPTTTAPAPPPPGPPFETGPAAASARSDALALLADVRLGSHEGYERIAFEFLPGSSPGYRVRYVRPPIVEEASGMVVKVDGDAFLSIRIEPASGFDLTGELGEVYTGPTRIDGSSTGTEIEEVVRTGDFEAVLTWVAGLDERTPFRVLRLSGPPRIVVDVRMDD